MGKPDLAIRCLNADEVKALRESLECSEGEVVINSCFLVRPKLSSERRRELPQELIDTICRTHGQPGLLMADGLAIKTARLPGRRGILSSPPQEALVVTMRPRPLYDTAIQVGNVLHRVADVLKSHQSLRY